MSQLKALKDIPTLASLYRTRAIRQSSKPDLAKGNQDLNDTICTVRYDITKLEVDAIVNAANKRLLGGGGVDGAIHRAAGPQLFLECSKLDGCETGSAKITDAYNLPCKKVIHAVGPIFESTEESEPLLKGCYKTALQLAVENSCSSIAFSAISTGIYGYPSDEAARAAVREVATFLRKPEGRKLEKVIFCSFEAKDENAYAEVLPEICPPTDADLSEQVLNTLDTINSFEEMARKEVQTEEKEGGAIDEFNLFKSRDEPGAANAHLFNPVNFVDPVEADQPHSKGGTMVPLEESVHLRHVVTPPQEGNKHRCSIDNSSGNITDTISVKPLYSDPSEFMRAVKRIKTCASNPENINEHKNQDHRSDDNETKQQATYMTESFTLRLDDISVSGSESKSALPPPSLFKQSDDHENDNPLEASTYNDPADTCIKMVIEPMATDPDDCVHIFELGRASFGLWPSGRYRCVKCSIFTPITSGGLKRLERFDVVID